MWSKMSLRPFAARHEAIPAVCLPWEDPVKLGVVPDNFLERLALLSGMLPPGIFECWFGIMLARTVMAATKLEVFESLEAGPLTAEEVARRCGTNLAATEKLLNALVGIGCVQVRHGRYGLV